MDAKERILENGYEDVVVFENPSYDDALIGISESNQAIYDYEKMLEYLITEDGMDLEEAADYISYNTIRSLPYVENAPIIMYPFAF